MNVEGLIRHCGGISDIVRGESAEIVGGVITLINADGTHTTKYFAQDQALYNKLVRASSPGLSDYTMADLFREFPLRTKD